MPVIVIGADTAIGDAVVAALASRQGEVRAFVSDASVVQRMRDLGTKVAVGDVSDGSHVAGAASGCFTAIVCPEAAFDSRERSFARSPAVTITTWATALSEASITRLVWVEDPRVAGADAGFRRSISEVAVVSTQGRNRLEIAAEVAHLDDLETFAEV